MGIWSDVLNLAFEFVSSTDQQLIQTGLNIYNFLFVHLANELSQYNDKFVEIFKAALAHENLDVASTALAAVCNYLTIAPSKYASAYQVCLEGMVNVPLRALAADDEKLIDDSLVEFNNVAEAEPKFFVPMFKELFFIFTKLIEKNDYTNMSIRHQPLEFLVSIADRETTLITQDLDMLKGLLDLTCKLMIDIDQDFDDDWANPKPGFKLKDEQEDDSVIFALECINRIFHAGGEEIVLGPVSILIENLLANEDDWRFKNAGLHILSQIGEFVDDVELLKGNIITQCISHLNHPHPKVRYATLHMIGQLANDLKEKFTEAFHEVLVPNIVPLLNDPIVRV